MESPQGRQLAPARRTPARPQIEKQRLSGERSDRPDAAAGAVQGKCGDADLGLDFDELGSFREKRRRIVLRRRSARNGPPRAAEPALPRKTCAGRGACSEETRCASRILSIIRWRRRIRTDQIFPNQLARPPEAAFGRLDRQAEPLANLRDGQFLEVAQQNDLQIFGRKRFPGPRQARRADRPSGVERVPWRCGRRQCSRAKTFSVRGANIRAARW